MKYTSIPLYVALVVVMAALTGVGNPALAFIENDNGVGIEIPLLQFDLTHSSNDMKDGERDDAVALISQRYGGNWRIYSWNSQSKTPSAIYGSGAQVASSLASMTDVESVAREIINANTRVLKANNADLSLVDAPNKAGKWGAIFQQTYNDLDVWGGRVKMTFTEEGRMFHMGSTYYSDITVNPSPTLSLSDAERIARNDVPFNAISDKVEEGGTLLILPVPVSEDEVSHRLVWRVRVHTEEPLGIWMTHVDAHSGEIVWRYNDIHFLDFQGTSRVDVSPESYCNPIEEQALTQAQITVSGVGDAVSDANGDWSLSYGGSDPKTVTAVMYGPYCSVNNQSGSNASFSGTATPGVPFELKFDASNSQHDERCVYDGVNDLHDFFEIIDPGYWYANRRMPATVSINLNCNAYWNSSGDGNINFYTAGGGCANTGEIQGVVQHEFGHGIQYSILGWQGDQGLGEGNSDILANLVTQESIIGRGFYLNQCTDGIRNSDNDLSYPGDVIGQSVHSAGRVIAGFGWDLMIGLQALYGTEQGTIEAAEIWHYCRILTQPTTQPDQVLSAFLIDDDDGNLDNGTPHYELICAAALNHGFTCPEILVGVLISHVPVMSTEDEGDVSIIAEIYSTEAPLVAEELLVHYQVNEGAYQQVVMTSTGGVNEYEGIIPGLVQPSAVNYYISGRDENNNSCTAPSMAPIETYAFSVAMIVDDFESNDGWVVNAEGTDDASTGIWARVNPIGTAAQPEDDHTPDPGTICWVTANGPAGGGVGEQDVDDGTTTVYSPEFDLTDALSARVHYWRWYSNTEGADPHNDDWVVQVSNDGGGWVDLERNELDMNMWSYQGFDILSLFGDDISQIQFKFVASDLNSGSIIEAAFDDFELLANLGNSATDDEEGSALRFALHGSSSNPMVGSTDIRFQVPATVDVSLKMYDITGRNIAVLANDTFTSGSHTISWDGTDTLGQPVASGVYYCRMKAPGFQVTRTIVVSQ